MRIVTKDNMLRCARCRESAGMERHRIEQVQAMSGLGIRCSGVCVTVMAYRAIETVTAACGMVAARQQQYSAAGHTMWVVDSSGVQVKLHTLTSMH